MVIHLLVEGRLDEAVGHMIIESAGGNVGPTYGLKGASYIEANIDGFNRLAQGVPILALVDLADVNFTCPAEVVEQWLPHRNDQMLFRVVVQEIESWLLADRSSIAQFLGVRRSLVPYHPENLPDPKRSLVELARSSRYVSLKHDLVPNDPTQNDQGPGYTFRMEHFVRQQWDLEASMPNAPSLRRCVRRVRQLVQA